MSQPYNVIIISQNYRQLHFAVFARNSISYKQNLQKVLKLADQINRWTVLVVLLQQKKLTANMTFKIYVGMVQFFKYLTCSLAVTGSSHGRTRSDMSLNKKLYPHGPSTGQVQVQTQTCYNKPKACVTTEHK